MPAHPFCWSPAVRCGAFSFCCALLVVGLVHLLAGASALIEEGPADDDQPPSKPVVSLTVFIAEEPIEEPGDDDSSANVIKSGTTFVNPAALDLLNPWEAQVDEMLIALLEVFEHTVAAEFYKGRSVWLDVSPWNGAQVDPDGFFLTGRLLPPHTGHIVLHAGVNGLRANVHVNTIGRFEIVPAEDNLFHTVEHVAPSAFECLVEGMMEFETTEDEFSGEGGIAGATGSGCCTGDCDDGCTIDIIMLYTDNAEVEAIPRGRGIRVEIELAIMEANVSFVNSAVDDECDPATPLQFRMVYMLKVEDYDDNPQPGDPPLPG